MPGRLHYLHRFLDSSVFFVCGVEPVFLFINCQFFLELTLFSAPKNIFQFMGVQDAVEMELVGSLS